MGNNVSSGRKAPKITSQDKAILQLKIQRDKLRKTSIKVQTVIKRENEIARQCVRKGDKRRALLALKKRKYQENLLDTVGKQSDSLDSYQYDRVQTHREGCGEGNKVLKQLNTELSVDKVDKIMDETAEGVSYQEELSERLGELMPRALDAEVDEELERMEREEAEKTEEGSKNEAAKLGELPAAPSGELIDGGRKEEKERREKGEKPQAVPA
ncbi:hypothetical protein HII12_003656 [Brettanomyces bruxellensis]|uniref:Charged multivesicular body protein 6 n=1 Tax=Dekkera bruxellensis TaxID=5007 RepID=A0A8H6ET14_DEKBR|nr:hypothetical protein HII12_003656 [Brettanomyces bruxellensis]